MPCACYIICTNRLDFLIYLSANCAPYGREKEKRVMMNNGGKVCAVRICDPVRLRPESGVGVLGVVSGGEMTLVRGDTTRIVGEKEAFFLSLAILATHTAFQLIFIYRKITKFIFTAQNRGIKLILLKKIIKLVSRFIIKAVKAV